MEGVGVTLIPRKIKFIISPGYCILLQFRFINIGRFYIMKLFFIVFIVIHTSTMCSNMFSSIIFGIQVLVSVMVC